MSFYKRHLPHWQPDEGEYFVTFRLAGTLPVEVIKKLKKLKNDPERGVELNSNSRYSSKIFQKYENLLDADEKGPTWLKEKKIAQVVQTSLHFFDEKEYELYAYCIMPNHVHIVFKLIISDVDRSAPKKIYPVTDIVGRIKSYTALESNKILNRKGSFWQSESYDRVIRDANELENTIAYILNNPVKACLVKKWSEWPYTYCQPRFIDYLEM